MNLIQTAQVLGGFCATIGLVFVGWQIWRARQARALEVLQKFLDAMNEREAALRDAENERHAFVEFMNFLEVYAAASNKRLVTGVAREFVNDKLIDSIVLLQQSKSWHPEVATSVNSEAVYKHLLTFAGRHRRLIATRDQALKPQ